MFSNIENIRIEIIVTLYPLWTKNKTKQTTKRIFLTSRIKTSFPAIILCLDCLATIMGEKAHELSAIEFKIFLSL